ncbi:MFS transporter [Curtobacterium sp. MCPF17_018]|uniref:MFS transporter n=1 Tax=Curtobacterium sp. MCPF17_018 TaxID=2175638 RepID=UPI0015E8B6C2|nr:MFS transporter [Curtobacterium sp. MCPF17_018]
MEVPVTQQAPAAFGSEDISQSLHSGPGTVRLKKRQLLPMFVAQFTLYLAWIAPLGYSLAVRIAQVDPNGRDNVLAFALSMPGILVLFVAPLLGVLSDRTRSRLGRRRPWLLAGTIVGAGGAVVLGLGATVPMVIVGWTISFVGYTMVAAMIVTHLGDTLPEVQRGKVMGINGAMTQIAPVVGTALAASTASMPAAMFLIPGALAFIGGIIFFSVMKDKRLAVTPPAVNVKALLSGYWFNPRRYPNLGWVVLSRAMVFLALSFFGLYTVYLLSSRLGLDAAQVGALSAAVGLGGVVTAILGAVGSGWLSDKLGRRKPFLIVSALLLASAMVLIATMNSIPQYVVAALLSSFAIGVYGAVDQATGLDVMPREGENGRYLAIFSLGNQVPQAFGPLLAAVVLSLFGGEYGWVYIAAGAFAVLGALAIIPIRLGNTMPAKENA